MTRRTTTFPRLRAAAPLSLALGGALLLAGCAAEPRGAGDIEALEPVSLEVAEDGAPTVSVDGEITAEEISSRVLKDGEGEEIDAGDLASVQTAIVDPASGEIQAENFTQGSEAVVLDENLQQSNQVLYDMLEQNRVGAQVAFYIPAGQLGEGAGEQLMVFQIADAGPARADGEPVEVTDESLPAVTLDEESGEPTIATPEGDAPGDLVVQPLIEGDGEEVGPEDYVTVQYKGVSWSSGEEFDSSWSRGTVSSFPLTGVIEGWTEGLTGQRVGSQVLLVVPSDMGYGDEGTDTIEGGETLVFVVDILHSMPQPEAAAPEPEPSPSASE